MTRPVHRPGMIFGLAAGNLMNFLGYMGEYAAICKHEGLPFPFLEISSLGRIFDVSCPIYRILSQSRRFGGPQIRER